MPVIRGRIRGLLVEVLIGSATVAGILLYATYGPFAWMPSLRWWDLAGVTVLTFWPALKQFRRYWHQLSFWLRVAALLAIHLLAYTVILLKIPDWRLLWFVPPSVVEAGLLVLVLHKLLDPRGPSKRLSLN